MDEIKSSTLQITGIFARLQCKQYTPENAIREVVLRKTEQIDANAEKMNNTCTIIDTRKKLADVSSQNFQLKREISKLQTELLKLKKENDSLSKDLSSFVNETFDDNSDDDLPVLQSSSDTIVNPGTPLLQSTPNSPCTPTCATSENSSETSQD